MNKPTGDVIGKRVKLMVHPGTVDSWWHAEGTITALGSMWGDNADMCIVHITKGPSLGRTNISWWQIEFMGTGLKDNILGWFPKKLEADDTVPDVDWNPFT